MTIASWACRITVKGMLGRQPLPHQQGRRRRIQRRGPAARRDVRRSTPGSRWRTRGSTSSSSGWRSSTSGSGSARTCTTGSSRTCTPSACRSRTSPELMEDDRARGGGPRRPGDRRDQPVDRRTSATSSSGCGRSSSRARSLVGGCWPPWSSEYRHNHGRRASTCAAGHDRGSSCRPQVRRSPPGASPAKPLSNVVAPREGQPRDRRSCRASAERAGPGSGSRTTGSASIPAGVVELGHQGLANTARPRAASSAATLDVSSSRPGARHAGHRPASPTRTSPEEGADRDATTSTTRRPADAPDPADRRRPRGGPPGAGRAPRPPARVPGRRRGRHRRRGRRGRSPVPARTWS